MDIVENIKKTIQDLILPELEIIKGENREIKTTLELTNKRLDDTNKRIDDINIHLVEQSRRIDEINKRIDRLYEVIVRRDEYEKLEIKIINLENEVGGIKREMQRLAA
jgi:uncharacterized coiled-coil DUF342 family protein